jgi:hypothetical protein
MDGHVAACSCPGTNFFNAALRDARQEIVKSRYLASSPQCMTNNELCSPGRCIVVNRGDPIHRGGREGGVSLNKGGPFWGEQLLRFAAMVLCNRIAPTGFCRRCNRSIRSRGIGIQRQKPMTIAPPTAGYVLTRVADCERLARQLIGLRFRRNQMRGDRRCDIGD